MRNRRQQWPDQERLWSPVLIALFAVVATVALVVIVEGNAVWCIPLAGLVAALVRDGTRAVEPFARFEHRYARSAFVADRFALRSRGRSGARRVAPLLRRLARISLSALGAMLFLIVVLVAVGARAPSANPGSWMLVLHYVAYAASYVGLIAVCWSVVLHRAIRDWNRRETSPLRDLPVVTAQELFARFGRPGPAAYAAWIAFGASVFALCVQ